MTNKQTVVSKDLAGKRIVVEREFAASPEHVWKAWTESSLLDQWWAPKPWKAETKTIDFREGGAWLYAMVGPEGERNWCRVDFKTIDDGKSYTVFTGFCDENGNLTGELPGMDWEVVFGTSDSGTKVTVTISFEDEADMAKILEMGFQEGFTMALGNLDEVLEG
jgi:uncharacterized protein YndB with AHSA1/START domain